MSAPSETKSDAAGSRTPPYVSYKTFQTLLDDLKTNGIPPQIDRSGLPRFSGGAVAQLLMALRSLGCLTDQAPTPRLHSLVKAYGTPTFAGEMKSALQIGYPFLANVDLSSATPSMFADAFKGVGSKEDVLKKCRRFYLQAAKDVGIPIGPRILNGPKGLSRGNGSAPSVPRKTRPAKKSPDVNGHGASNRGEVVNPPTETIEQQLIAKFPNFDPTWADPIKTAWFEGFKNLMSNTKNNSGD